MKNIIVAKDLTKVYEGKKNVIALKKLNFQIKEEEFLGIMGPSGSGKSTLLNNLATIDYPSSGTVELLGEDTKKIFNIKLAQLRYEHIGFIFQEFNLIDSLSIRENIAIPLTLAKKAIGEVKERVEAIANRLGIAEILDKYPVECSGGQRQRAAIGRAIVTKPKIIFADEPTGNLDTRNSHEILKILKELNKEGTTIIMVTHDSMIASYTEKIMFIRDGEVSEVINKEGKTQKEFFNDIVNVTSKEGQELFEMM